MPEKIDLQNNSQKIGSFRSSDDLQRILPNDLHEALFGDIIDTKDVSKLISLQDDKVFLNNAAFGRAYDEVSRLGKILRDYAERVPDVFYDQVCLPLLQYSYSVLEDFFHSKNVLMVPNCSFGMKCVAEHLFQKQTNLSIAFLSPLYGATKKLLQYYQHEGHIADIIEVNPGLIEEDPSKIVSVLEISYHEKPFTVLFCDETSSQSGRILPLSSIIEFCEKHGITLIVDGTQSCDLLLGKNIEILKKIDFFLMSTHKWIGNIKTCGIIKYKNESPAPPAISFGWTSDKSHESVRSSYMWQGMLDTYIPYITVSRALKIFKKYGSQQLEHASEILSSSFNRALKVVPLLDLGKKRVMNIFQLENSQFTGLSSEAIQNSCQEYGVFISLKKADVNQIRSAVYINGNLLGNKKRPKNNKYENIVNGVDHLIEVLSKQENNNGGANNHINGCKENGAEIEIRNFENGFLNSPTGRNGKTATPPLIHVRVSCWSYNTSDDYGKLSSLLHHNLLLSSTNKSSLKLEFLYSYELYEQLFSVLETKAFFIRAEKLRHHLIFYYAHTAVFYINKLVTGQHIDVSERIDPTVESIMSVGVDEMSWDDILEENYNWTGLSDNQLEEYLQNIQSYREQVKELILHKIEQNDLVAPIEQGSFQWVIMMGIEHERIHLETSAVIISQVPLNLIKKNHKFNFPTFWNGKPSFFSEKEYTAPPKNKLLRVPGGTVYMGKDNLEQNYYGWDNEMGQEKKELQEFQASQMLVSNAEYLEFVEAGGYSVQKWWSAEGWKYITSLNVSGPAFWIGKKHYRAMLEEIPMPWNLPVEVNNLEAEAFCKWKSEQLGCVVRMISLEESFHMRQLAVNEVSNNNLSKYASPTPVNMYGGQIEDEHFYDVSGNVWRHSCSVLTLMEGFKTDPIYNDFTLPTIDGFHNHILGGSWISIGNCANLNSRYGFRRHFQQYAGIRYVSSNNSYHDKVLKMYDEVEWTMQITEHYTNFTQDIEVDRKPIGNWPKLLGEKASKIINKYFNEHSNTNILVAYGGVGRTTLELLRVCNNLTVSHTDATANYLQVLGSLLEESRLQWHQQIEGKITDPMTFSLSPEETAISLLEGKNNKVSYYQADYENMRPQLNNYDVVIVDFRFKDCLKQLQHICSRLNAGGLLIMGSIQDPTKGHVQSFLNEYFTLINNENGKLYPHIYRETQYKHQYAISYFSFWQKKTSDSVNGSEDNEKDITNDEMEPVYYETADIVNSYEKFHYGELDLPTGNFPARMAEICVAACKKYGTSLNAALDAGCGPGRSAIELCRYFEMVEGYDYSQSFVDLLLAQKRKRGIKNLNVYRGDCHKQKETCGDKKFNLIFGGNLIDRLHSPMLWLQQSKEMLLPGGLLVITTPNTWRAEFTDPKNWIGGFKKDAEDYYTLDGLRDIMLPEFRLLEVTKVPFMIPDEDGTFQFTYSQCSIYGA